MRFAAFALALPVLAAANVLPRTDSGPSNQCNTGQISCCNSAQTASTVDFNSILGGLLGPVVSLLAGTVTGLVGVNCSPLSVIGLGGNSCSAQPVCCTGNNFSGLIVLGCSPINLNL